MTAESYLAPSQTSIIIIIVIYLILVKIQLKDITNYKRHSLQLGLFLWYKLFCENS